MKKQLIKFIRTPIINLGNLVGLKVEIKLKENLKKTTDKTFINIGAGDFSHPNWINVDKVSDFYKEYQQPNTIDYDLLELKQLPFENDSVDLIYTAHTIEHVTNEAVENLFEEAFKKLKKGGIMRITCPDILYLFNAYKRNDGKLFYEIKDYGDKKNLIGEEYNSAKKIDASIQQKFLWSFARQSSIHHNKSVNPFTDKQVDKLFGELDLEDGLNKCTGKCNINIQKQRPEEHINWFTEYKLVRMLKEAGFENVIVSRFNQSISEEMRNPEHFDNVFLSPTSLYVEVIKS